MCFTSVSFCLKTPIICNFACIIIQTFEVSRDFHWCQWKQDWICKPFSWSHSTAWINLQSLDGLIKSVNVGKPVLQCLGVLWQSWPAARYFSQRCGFELLSGFLPEAQLKQMPGFRGIRSGHTWWPLPFAVWCLLSMGTGQLSHAKWAQAGYNCLQC